MNEADLRETVRRVAQKHLEAVHPERVQELDAVFDTAFDTALERAAGASGTAAISEPARGIPFDASLADLSIVGVIVVAALHLVQTARLTRQIDQLRALIDASPGLSKAQKAEVCQLVPLVVDELMTWRPQRRAEPVAVAALQLLVQRSERHGRPRLEFRLHGKKGGRSYVFQPFGTVELDEAPEGHFQELFDRLVMHDAQSEEEQEVTDQRTRSRGARLFELFLPEKLQHELRVLARTGGDLLVVSEDPWIPWELLKFPRTDEDGETRFLGEAFAIARWFSGTSPLEVLPLRRLAIVRSELADLDRAEEESSFLMEQADRMRRRIEPVKARFLELTKAMAGGSYDAWHFIGHGGRSRAGAEWAELALDDRVMNPQDLSDEVAAGLGRQRPFVFLNACRTGASEPGLVGIGGWPARFLEIKAGAFLGPLWSVPSGCAEAFSRFFYERFLGGEPIGEAVRGARLALHERFPGDPTWLAYALYANPGAVCPGRGTGRAAEQPKVDGRQGKAWSDKREYKRLAGRLSEATGGEYESLVVRLLRPALGAWDHELLRLGEGLWSVGSEPPYPMAVQILRFEAPGEALGAEEAARARGALERMRRSSVEAEQIILVHNRHGGSAPFRQEVEAMLQDFVSAEGASGGVLWDYQQLLRRAFGGMLDLLVSESRRRSLSLATVAEVLGQASWRDEPLERIPLQTSILVADQYRLVGEEETERTVADPAALAVSGDERSITLLLGEFGFGKTTALARALLGHEKEVFFVPAAGMSDEVHGAKDLLSRCIDLDRLLEEVPEEDREDYRLLARPVVEYVFKQKEIDAVLVLDGLDESPFLARSGSLQNLINNLWDLRVPVVLSMRTEFWHDKLQDFEASFGDRAAHGERRVRRIRKLELLPWRDQDIQSFLERFSDSVEDEAGRERLRELEGWLEHCRFEEVYGDIPQRPLFLRMIAETVAAEGLPGRHVGRAGLLVDAVHLKIRRDITAPRRFGGTGRPSIHGRPMDVAGTLELAWTAMVAAAAKMSRPVDGSLELLPDCPYEELRGEVAALREVDDPLPLFLHSLLRLSEPRSGYRPARVRFAHRAFQEFFLAWHLVEAGRWNTVEVPETVAAWADDLRDENLLSGR